MDQKSTIARPTFPAKQAYPRNQWYVAAFSKDVVDKPLARTLLDTPVVLYRTVDGTPVALYDRCPHRGLPLSMGRLIGDKLQCGYHGMEFGTNGKAVFIPQQKQIYSSLCVRSYRVVDKGPYLFIWLGDAEADESLLPGNEWLTIDSPDAHIEPYEQIEIKANFQFLVDNLADTSHLSFLHGGLLDDGETAISQFRVEEGEQHCRMIREMDRVEISGPVAAMFRTKPNHPYRKVFDAANFIPSIHIGRISFYDLVDTAAPSIEFMVINAVTPSTSHHTYMFDCQGYLFPHGSETDKAIVHAVLEQDRIALEEIQRRYDQFGVTTELNIVSDQHSLLTRKIMDRLLEKEKGSDLRVNVDNNLAHAARA